MRDARTPLLSFRQVLVKVVQLRARTSIAAEDVALNPPWQDRGQLISHVSSSRDCEDVIQLFEGALLRFWAPL